MVKFLFQISAELKNLTDLQPQDGCNDPDFSYLFKLRCEWCGELSPRETCVSLNETVPLPARDERKTNVIRKRTAKVIRRRTANVIQMCKLCERVGMILMHPGLGKPLTQAASDARQFAPVMIFDFRGFVPVDFVFVGGWRTESGPESAFCRACTSYELQHICIKVLLFGQHSTDHVAKTVSTLIRDVLSGINFEHIDFSAGEFVEYVVEYPARIFNLQAAFVVGSFMPPEIRRGF